MKNRILNANPLRFSLLLLCLLLSTTLSAQTNSGFISGKVYEIIQGKHEPSIGVNVSIENDQRRVLTGVTTDVNGAFSLRVPSGAATLVFSFIGMETQRIAYTGQKTLTVVMESSSQELGEVTVAAQRTEMSDMGISVREQTAATQKINMSSVVETLPVSSIEEALQGRLAGVDIALLDQAMARYNDEQLPFGIVPVLALGNTWFADVDAHLSAVRRVNQLGKAAPVVHIHFQGIFKLFRRKIGQV